MLHEPTHWLHWLTHEFTFKPSYNMPPVEVINLLSSPDVAIPPPRPPKTGAAAKPNKAPARALDYDMLDLTAGDNGRPARTLAVAAAPGKRPTNSKVSAHDFSFLSSDDSELNAGLFDEAFAVRPSKKPRTGGLSDAVKGSGISSTSTNRPLQRTASGPEKSTTTSTFTFAATSTVGWGAPGVLQPAALRRWNTTVDPIQTSSDPFGSSPRLQKGREGKENNIIDLSLDDDLDPFASSPPLVKAKGKAKEKASASPRAIRSGQPILSSPFSSKGIGRRTFSPQAHKTLVPSSPLFMDRQPVSTMTSQLKQKGAKGKGKNAMAWDHISSSAPEANLDDDWDMDVQPSRKSIARSRSDAVDFDLGDPDAFPTDSDDDLPDLSGVKPTKSKSSVGRSISKVTKPRADSVSKKTLAEIESEKLDKVAAREAEKRRKQREKDEAKEQRRVEKERAAALAEVNKVRTDKKVSTPEMIVDLSTSLSPSTKLQIEALLSDLNVTSHSYASPVKNVVKWRRKVRARYNDAEGHWEPIPERIEPEHHALVIIPAAEFVELALGAKGTDLEAHVLQMQRYHNGHALIYLIEGLHPFMRKNATARNRQFQAAVRSAGAADSTTEDAPPPSNQQRKRKAPKPPPPHIDENLIEDALLSLQVQHNALIHHTAAPIDTAQWVAIFTQHISTIPYRRQKDTTTASAAFCMESGQVRTGENAHDTYLRMLQEIARVTAPIAYGIAGKFGSVGELVRGLEDGGPLVLEGVRKSANKDGAFSERCLGQAVSRRVWKVFTGRDENSTEI